MPHLILALDAQKHRVHTLVLQHRYFALPHFLNNDDDVDEYCSILDILVRRLIGSVWPKVAAPPPLLPIKAKDSTLGLVVVVVVVVVVPSLPVVIVVASDYLIMLLLLLYLGTATTL